MKEEVLIRKLIADGDGAGEEKKFAQIASFWRDARRTDKKIGDAVKCLKALDSLDLSIRKQKHVAAMNVIEQANYTEVFRKVDEQIKETYQAMETAKQQLADARVVKRNRQEYSTVVKVVQENPSRAECDRQLEEVREDLRRVVEKQRQLENKILDRKNQFQAVNILLYNFQQFLNDDNELCADDETESVVSEADEKMETEDSQSSTVAGPEPMQT